MFSMLLVVLIGFVPLAPSNDVDAEPVNDSETPGGLSLLSFVL